MTNQELAEWFGILEKSLRSTRVKKLEILQEYAEFENMRGKVNITKIIKPVYSKNKNYNFIKEKTQEQWNETGLDTCKLVSEKIKNKYSEYKEVQALKDSTRYTYVCQSKRENWGKAFLTEGELGHCVYELSKEIDGECIEFTEEEKEIKNKLLKKYFGNAEEKCVFIQDMLNNGEITTEEVGEVLQDIMNLDKNYMLFKNELEEILGAKVVRATRVETNVFKTIKNGNFEY